MPLCWPPRRPFDIEVSIGSGWNLRGEDVPEVDELLFSADLTRLLFEDVSKGSGRCRELRAEVSTGSGLGRAAGFEVWSFCNSPLEPLVVISKGSGRGLRGGVEAILPSKGSQGSIVARDCHARRYEAGPAWLGAVLPQIRTRVVRPSSPSCVSRFGAPDLGVQCRGDRRASRRS